MVIIMSKRNSEYERKENDLYETPEWVTHALIPHIPLRIKTIWECACGSGKMVRPLEAAGFTVIGSDLDLGDDFFQSEVIGESVIAIVTNPPFNLAHKFVDKALDDTKEFNGFVAMLLPVDYDSAKTRRHQFLDCKAWKKKLVLTRRIKWFDEPVPCKKCNATGLVDGVKCKPCKGEGEKMVSPSENHAWYIWDWTNEDNPTIDYYVESSPKKK